MSNPTGKGGFKKGQIANPKGRPKGSRHKLAESFLKALVKDFDEHGESALKSLREASPAKYAEIIAGLLPKQVDVQSDSTVTYQSEAVAVTERWLEEILGDQADRKATDPLPN